MASKAPSLTRSLISGNTGKFFVTTPIYYANASPHIGHLYSSVIADAANRWRQLTKIGAKFKFSTGTDEHGSKIQRAAASFGVNPSDYCSKISEQYRLLAKDFSVGFTDFVRTSEERHCNVVQKFWGKLCDNGHVYSSNYKGWYCVSDETFLTESQLKEKIEPDGHKIIISAESGHPVEWTEELNYMFSLHSFQDDLVYWIKRNEGAIQPAKFRKIVLDMLEAGPLPDLSISRPSSRVHWGVPVPNDASQTVYVWVDALANYLTAAGYGDNPENFQQTWPPDVQVIGKDILKFHAIYWPAFLMASNLEPPHSILCHSHWTVDSEKMSKSKKNVVCPFNRSELYTSDGLRYFLLREGVAHSDGNYSDTKVIRILNSELADTLGNLLSRCCGNSLNPNRRFPGRDSGSFNKIASQDVTKKLLRLITELPENCRKHYDDYNFYKAVDNVVATLHQANVFFETLKPWELRKSPDKLGELDTVLHLTLETLRVSGLLLQPIVPNISKNLLDQLNVPSEDRCFESCHLNSDPGDKLLGAPSQLFKRIQLEDATKRRVKT